MSKYSAAAPAAVEYRIWGLCTDGQKGCLCVPYKNTYTGTINIIFLLPNVLFAIQSA